MRQKLHVTNAVVSPMPASGWLLVLWRTAAMNSSPESHKKVGKTVLLLFHSIFQTKMQRKEVKAMMSHLDGCSHGNNNNNKQLGDR